MKSALIIEKMPCHQEIIPSWVWALTRLGYDVHIAARAPPHRHIFHAMQEVMKLTGFTFIDPTTVNLQDYDVVLNNSLYPNEAVPHLSQPQSPDKRVLSVLHRLPEKDLDFRDFAGLRNQQHCLLALGPHMQAKLESPLYAMRSVWTPPIFFGDAPSIYKERSRFLVQGTMERFRRNYGCLVGLLNGLGDTHAFEIVLMGDGGQGVVSWIAPQVQPSHRTRLKALLNAGYDRFLVEIRQAGWVMPCVDETFEHGYFDRKITSSVMMAIGNCTPLVLHQRLADLYGLVNGESCLTYTDDKESLATAFVTALEMPEENYYKLVSQVRDIRLRWLDQLYQGVQKAVAKK